MSQDILRTPLTSNVMPKEVFHTASLVFFIVYALIIFRNLKRTNLPVWVIMFAGAVSLLFLNGIALRDAYSAVNIDVIFFLIGMFSIVSALEASGLLKYLTLRILSFADSPDRVLFFTIIVLGTMSAFLMNDTIAIAATPIIISIAREVKIKPTPFLITLAFAVSIGSTMTPMGNPQNLLIALDSGIEAPLLTFLKFLGPPTVINCFVTYYLLKFYYRKDLARGAQPHNLAWEDAVTDMHLAKISGIIAVLTIAGFFALNILKVVGYETELNFGTVALLGAAALFSVSSRRREIIRGVNWSIIIFFISMFIVMQAVWNNGLIKLFTLLLPPITHTDSSLTILNIVVASVVLSQFMSNVPFVAVYTHVMKSVGFNSLDVEAWMALAGGSTLAGNLTILGAASTIIILEASEEEDYTFSFSEYFKIGSLVTAANVAILVLWLFFV
ncbi:MAG: SLC13 family permease [Candidatus Bathyarchaeia archaeon]